MMELECAKLETRLSRMNTTSYRKHRRSKKTRWDLDDLDRETMYLDNMARKALSPLSLYPSVKKVDYFEENSDIPRIREPHRVSEKIQIVEVQKERRRAEPTKIKNLFVSENKKNFDFSAQKETKHHRTQKQKNTFRINRIIANATPPQNKRKTYDLHGPPPVAGIDEELENFVDEISDFGKWND